MASLQLLCQQGIASALREEKDVGKLNMPSLLCSYVTSAFIPTIKVGLTMNPFNLVLTPVFLFIYVVGKHLEDTKT